MDTTLSVQPGNIYQYNLSQGTGKYPQYIRDIVTGKEYGRGINGIVELPVGIYERIQERDGKNKIWGFFEIQTCAEGIKYVGYSGPVQYLAEHGLLSDSTQVTILGTRYDDDKPAKNVWAQDSKWNFAYRQSVTELDGNKVGVEFRLNNYSRHTINHNASKQSRVVFYRNSFYPVGFLTEEKEREIDLELVKQFYLQRQSQQAQTTKVEAIEEKAATWQVKEAPAPYGVDVVSNTPSQTIPPQSEINRRAWVIAKTLAGGSKGSKQFLSQAFKLVWQQIKINAS